MLEVVALVNSSCVTCRLYIAHAAQFRHCHMV